MYLVYEGWGVDGVWTLRAPAYPPKQYCDPMSLSRSIGADSELTPVHLLLSKDQTIVKFKQRYLATCRFLHELEKNLQFAHEFQFDFFEQNQIRSKTVKTFPLQIAAKLPEKLKLLQILTNRSIIRCRFHN